MNIMNIIFLASILILSLILICKNNKSGYINYGELYDNPILNCPEQYEIGIGQLSKKKTLIQPFGYTKNYLFDITRFKDPTTQSMDFNNLKLGKPIEKFKPLPVDPDFFDHI